MKAFTKAVKHKVFDVVKNNDIKGYNDLCKDAENYSVLEKIRVCYGSLTGFQRNASIKGVKNMFYGKNALLVRCGNYIYNVTENPSIYYSAR